MLNKRKSLVYSKLSNFDEKYLSKLDDVDNYLNTDNNYFIGKINYFLGKSSKNGMRLDLNNKLIPYSFVGPKNLFEDKINTFMTRPSYRGKTNLMTNLSRREPENSIKNTPRVYKIVDNFDVNRLYDQIQLRVKNSNVKTNIFF